MSDPTALADGRQQKIGLLCTALLVRVCAGLGWDYGSVDRIHPLQIVVLFDAAGTQLTDMSGLLAPVVDRLVLPAAKLLGFKAQYSSHRSRRSASVQQVEAELASEGLTDGRQHANEHTEL